MKNLIFVLIMGLMISGCATASRQDKAGLIWLENKGDCKYRCRRLIQSLNEDCFLVHGTMNGEPHRWVETMDGEILDSSFPDFLIEEGLYIETSREFFHNGVSQGIVSEISDEDYEKWLDFIDER